jgi:hypothetical protein
MSRPAIETVEPGSPRVKPTVQFTLPLLSSGWNLVLRWRVVALGAKGQPIPCWTTATLSSVHYHVRKDQADRMKTLTGVLMATDLEETPPK